jgi:hypothetical protein
MAYVGKQVFVGRHRSVLAITVLAVTALLLFETRLAEMFLTFCFGGVVPGTGIVLSPNAVIIIMVSAAWLTIMLALAKLLIGRARKRRHIRREMTILTRVSRTAIELTPQVPTSVERADPGVIGEIATVPATRTRREVEAPLPEAAELIRNDGLRAAAAADRHRKFRARIKYFFAASVGTAIDLAELAAMVVAWTGRRIGRVARALAVTVAAGSVWMIMSGRKMLRMIWRWSFRQAGIAWRWSAPHLWKFDEWLELRIRMSEAWIARKVNSSDMIRSSILMVREYRKSLTALSFRMAFKQVPQRFRKTDKSQSTSTAD